MRVEGSPALGGILSAVDVDGLKVSGCAFPSAPGSDDDGATAVTASGPPHVIAVSPTNALHAAISVVDSTICLESVEGGASTPNPPCFMAYGSIYLSNVFTSGCPTLVAPNPMPAGPGSSPYAPVPAAPGAKFTHVPLLALGRKTDTTPPPPPAHPYTYAFPAYTNGTRRIDGVANVLPHEGPPPHDLQSKHLWAPDAGLTFQSAGAVSAIDMGAKGDGVTDDWEVLQAAVDKHPVVYGTVANIFVITSHASRSSLQPHTRRATCSAKCPLALGADWH